MLSQGMREILKEIWLISSMGWDSEEWRLAGQRMAGGIWGTVPVVFRPRYGAITIPTTLFSSKCQ